MTIDNLRNADPIQHWRVLHKTVASSILSASFRTSTNTTADGYNVDPVSSHVYRGTLSWTCFRLSACPGLVDSFSESRSLPRLFADHGHICYSSVSVGFRRCGWIVIADEDAPGFEDPNKTQSWPGSNLRIRDCVS